jgi:hypothetical protein
MTSKQQANDDACERESGICVGGDFVLGLLDERLGQVGEEVAVRGRGAVFEQNRGCGCWRAREVLVDYVLNVLGLRISDTAGQELA